MTARARVAKQASIIASRAAERFAIIRQAATELREGPGRKVAGDASFSGMNKRQHPVCIVLVPCVRRGDREATAALASWLEDEWLIPRGLSGSERIARAREFADGT